jgi:hypothetical protein
MLSSLGIKFSRNMPQKSAGSNLIWTCAYSIYELWLGNTPSFSDRSFLKRQMLEYVFCLLEHFCHSLIAYEDSSLMPLIKAQCKINFMTVCRVVWRDNCLRSFMRLYFFSMSLKNWSEATFSELWFNRDQCTSNFNHTSSFTVPFRKRPKVRAMYMFNVSITIIMSYLSRRPRQQSTVELFVAACWQKLVALRIANEYQLWIPLNASGLQICERAKLLWIVIDQRASIYCPRRPCYTGDRANRGPHRCRWGPLSGQ